jgi:zearalenone synthase (highly reducing iterative type I polyketide synthase)
MTHEQWQGAIRPKVQGSWVLHHLVPRDLQFFVMLSSIAGVVGNRSQANYAAGNTYQDALAHYRRRHGLTAVSVDLGLMVGIGLIAERGGATNLKKSEAIGINETEFHALITAAMVGSFGKTEMPPQVICGLPIGGILDREKLDMPFYFDDLRFQLLKKKDRDRTEVQGEDVSHEAHSLSSQLSECRFVHETSGIITTALCGRLARGLQTAVEDIDSSKPLHAYGVDSLMAVEIRTWILMNLKAEISLFDVLSGNSVAALASKIAAVSKLVSKELD